jgi:hypothetical protein
MMNRWTQCFARVSRTTIAGAFIAVLLSAAGAEETQPTTVRRAVSKLMRDAATATDDEQRHSALESLCDAYVAIRLHPGYDDSEILRGEAAKVRRRLITESDRMSDELKRNGIEKPEALTRRVDEAIKESVAAQQQPATISGDEHNHDVVQDIEAIQDRQGGAAIADEAWALVELIQRTVHPDFWESTGGPGSIHYFAIKRVLVVRATTQVHEDLVALLRQL